MRRGLVAATALLIASAVSVVGCSSSGSSSKSTTTTAGKSYQISTGDGEATLSLDGKLPSGWPSDFPLPNGAKPAGSGSIAGKSDGVMVAVYTLSGSAQDAFDFYKNAAGLTVTDSSSVGGGNAFVGNVKFSGKHSGNVTTGTIGSDDGLVVVLDTSAPTSSSSSSSTVQ